MAKQNADIAKIFSFGDLAIAGAMSKRAVQHIVEARLLPEGKGIQVLKRVAVIGGFVGVGVPLLAASRIARAILDEFNQTDGEVPIGFAPTWMSLSREVRERTGADPSDDYTLHKVFFENPELYRPGAAMSSDVLVEIVDKKHLFITQEGGMNTLSLYDNARDDASYSGQINGWERGSEITVKSAASMFSFDPAHPDFREHGRQYIELVREIRPNAVGKITINASLAVRNGLDRLATYYAERRQKRKSARKVSASRK